VPHRSGGAASTSSRHSARDTSRKIADGVREIAAVSAGM
jgi:hypothetical protein